MGGANAHGGGAHHTHTIKPRGAHMAPGLPFNAGRWRSETNAMKQRVRAAPPRVGPSVRVHIHYSPLISTHST